MAKIAKPELSKVLEDLCDAVDKEYEQNSSTEVEFYQILFKAYVNLRLIRARKGMSSKPGSAKERAESSTSSEASSTTETQQQEEKQPESTTDIFTTEKSKRRSSGKSDPPTIKKEIGDIPVKMMGKLLDSKEANLFLQSYISLYLEKVDVSSG